MEYERFLLDCGGITLIMPAVKKTNRRAQILQALAGMLETNAGQRITTAKLAEKVGVSEAALYRHFPSKARMFEGLIEFIEETLFTRINKIVNEEKDSAARCQLILHLILSINNYDLEKGCL